MMAVAIVIQIATGKTISAAVHKYGIPAASGCGRLPCFEDPCRFGYENSSM